MPLKKRNGSATRPTRQRRRRRRMPPQQKRRRTCYGRSQLPPHVVHETHTHTHTRSHIFCCFFSSLDLFCVYSHMHSSAFVRVFSDFVESKRKEKGKASKVKITLCRERESRVMAMASSSPSMANSHLLSSIDKHKHRTYRQSAVNDQCVGGALLQQQR